MRIGFNGQRLSGQQLGVGRYIQYLLRNWEQQLLADDEVTIFLRSSLDWTFSPSAGQIRKIVRPSGMSGIPWENLQLRAAASDVDVLFCPAYTAPVGFRKTTVVATHSVTEVQPGVDTWLYRQTYSRLHALCARQAAAVIVPSQITRDSVVDFYGVQPERIAVVPQGADEAFRPGTSPSELEAVRRRFFGENRPFILFVGKCSRRRNIPRLLTAFARLKDSQGIPHGLLLFGPNHQDLPLAAQCRELGIDGDVVQTDGRITEHAELVPIYSAAEVFVHPSEYEGWSMTTVEAMACGTPVVAANRGGLREVAEGHALMVDDPTVDALADAIGKVLADSALHADLSRRAAARGAALNWSTISRDTLQVIRDAARGDSPTLRNRP